MEKFEIVLNLEHIAAQRKVWNEAAREFGKQVDTAMKRLIHEAAAKRMSAQEVGKSSGFSTAQIKARMKAMNLNPTTGKVLLSKQAADVLNSNAEILGIQPHEIDLMSPLAYLPAGSLLKHETADVHDLDDFGFPETRDHDHQPPSPKMFAIEVPLLRDLLTKAYTAGYRDRRVENSHEPNDAIDEIMAEADEAGA